MTMDNKALVETFFERITRGEIDDAFKVVSDDVEWWVPGTLPSSGTKDKAGYMKVAFAIRGGFPTGFALRVVGMIAEGDKVAAEVESEGQHVNGKAYRNKYHFLITIADRQIIAVKEYMDTLHLHDLITAPAPKP